MVLRGLTNVNTIFLESCLKPVPQSRHWLAVLVLLHTDEDPHGQLQLSANFFHLELELLLFLHFAVESILIRDNDECIAFVFQLLQALRDGFVPPNPVVCILGPLVLAIHRN